MMRGLMMICVLVVIPGLASAGQNPNIYAYVDFDPPKCLHRVDPEVYGIVSAYFMLDCVGGGLSNISVRLYVTPETNLAGGYENLLPSPHSIGDFEDGIVLASFDCPGGSPLPFAVAHVVYSGVPGDVMLLDHPQWPRWVVDCTGPVPQVDYYCLLSHGGVGKDPVPTGEMCGCPSPVRDESWGSIKAMFK